MAKTIQKNKIFSRKCSVMLSITNLITSCTNGQAYGLTVQQSEWCTCNISIDKQLLYIFCQRNTRKGVPTFAELNY